MLIILCAGTGMLTFKATGNRSKLTLSIPENIKLNLFITPDASGWYERHKTRSNQLSDTIDDVKYSEQFGVSSTKMTSQIAFGVVGGLLIFTLFGALGIGVIALGLYGQSGGVAALGVLSIAYGSVKGANFARNQCNDAKSIQKRDGSI
jgi:hypothetical protein